MTTPRVTEIPLRLAAVERDPFADAPIGWRNPLERQTDLVRAVMRARAQGRGAEAYDARSRLAPRA